MSRARHDGVTCDVCNAHNFSGKRYKCLVCFDYDLCVRCYESGQVSSNHSIDHAMQCILTRSDFDIHFAGENLPYQRAQSYTCPLCGVMGFTLHRMREHVTSEHGRSHREVICPVCATSSGYNANQMTTCLGPHLSSDHISAGRQNSTEERLASMRRHLSPSQADGSAANSTASGARRRSGAAAHNGSAEFSRGSTDMLRAAWLPTGTSSQGRSSGSAQPGSSSTPTPGVWSRADADLSDYGEYLSLQDSLVHGSQSERLRERIAAEASRHGDPNSPLYRYLAHPRFAGSGLRAASQAPSGQAQATPAAGSSGSGSQRSVVQFPSNHWECLMNTTAPPGEFVLPGLLDDDSLLSAPDDAEVDLAATGTTEERAGFASELLLSMLDVRLDANLLEHLETLSSESEHEQSVETDV